MPMRQPSQELAEQGTRRHHSRFMAGEAISRHVLAVEHHLEGVRRLDLVLIIFQRRAQAV